MPRPAPGLAPGQCAGEPGGMDLHATVESMFAPARHPGLVGVELELIPVTDTPLPRPVAPAWLAAAFDTGFVRAAVPTFEPGGQLELRVCFEMGAPDKAGLDELARRLDDLGEPHGQVLRTPVGWVLTDLYDPDGHEIRCYVTDEGAPTASRPARMHDAGPRARIEQLDSLDWP